MQDEFEKRISNARQIVMQLRYNRNNFRGVENIPKLHLTPSETHISFNPSGMSDDDN